MPEDEQPRGFGRTIWDVLAEGKKKILLFLIIVAAIGVLIYCFMNYREKVTDYIKEYWPLVISPIVGWLLGSYVVNAIYSTRRRVVMTLDVATHMVRFISIPDKMFNDMQQSGNNVVYHTPYGTPVYIANSVNMDTMEIDYGWVHELNSVVVMTREDAYQKWDKTLNDVLEENLELMSHPHVIGLGYARQSLREHLDEIAVSLGFMKKDMKAHKDVDESKEIGNEEFQDAEIPQGGDELGP